MLRYLTAGESHGRALVAVLEGLPAGVPLTSAEIAGELARRRLGYGRGKRMRFEEDRLEVLGGLRHGLTLGSPLAVRIDNSEWPKWTEVMSPDPVQDPEAVQAGKGVPLTRPRPGHADLTGMQKYGFSEARPVLERASARETAARVAAGAAAKALLAQVGVAVLSHVVRLGPVATRSRAVPTAADLEEIDASPVRCLDGEAEGRMAAAVDAAKAAGDTLGGVFEVVAHGLPPGLGSYVQWDRKLDARLAGALMSIQAIKGVEVGDGFAGAARPGSRAHDAIVPATGGPEGSGEPRGGAPVGREGSGKPRGGAPVGREGSGEPQGGAPVGRPRRRTGRAGGIEGGMSTGETLRVRAAMKPLSTLVRALDTVDLATGAKAKAVVQRSDVTAVPAAGVVGEAVVALVLADALLEKTGGDSLAEVRRNLDNYLDALGC
jgi:chorismate synthase